MKKRGTRINELRQKRKTTRTKMYFGGAAPREKPKKEKRRKENVQTCRADRAHIRVRRGKKGFSLRHTRNVGNEKRPDSLLCASKALTAIAHPAEKIVIQVVYEVD